jgi:bifunctional DNA-binding transcriptional regulator/antitoxin component of YhaV-PrlF toxin-antitoxin module
VVIPDYLWQEMGIQQGTRLAVYREQDRLVLQPVTDDFIRSLRGCAKGATSLVEAREREHRVEKDRLIR